MAEGTLRGPAVLAPIGRGWRRISPRLVPVLAVVTAFIIGIPFMTLTSGRGDIGAGLRIAGSAYSALIEGATGLVINSNVSAEHVNLVVLLAESTPLTPRGLNDLARDASRLITMDAEQVRRFGTFLSQFELGDEEIDELGSRLPDIERIGADTLAAMQPLLNDLSALQRSEVRGLAEDYGVMDELSAEDRVALEEVVPSAADYSDEDLLRYMAIVNDEGIVALERTVEQIAGLDELGLSADDRETLAQIAVVTAEDARGLAATQDILDDAGITDPMAASEQLILVRRMYDAGVLQEQDVQTALATEFDNAVRDNLVVLRAGNRLVVDQNYTGPFGTIYNINNTPDDPTDDRPETVYFRFGGSTLLFFPANLEATLLRAIPYIIAGLAVALGFKAGLFNIGAEGQLYIGATFAVWVGYYQAFGSLPGLVHIPLVIIAGLIGGALWGSIPGLLKAYTGAHEVITTIMLNFIAILTVDWLIKSTDPVIMQDPSASIPRTPVIAESARLTIFSNIAPIWFIIAGIVVAALGLYARRTLLAQNPRAAIRPVIYGLLVTLGGFALSWLAVRNNLHIGLIIMVFAVWFTDWFLTRTTLGFELRTVGANPDAARYSGMSVPRNIVLAMAISGALAGLAGTIQVSGVQFNMQPAFFAGLGFDAIAVALLARTNPRNMIAAGLLWGGLLTGAGLMQINANISVDLVKIIQALIIMFIAADTIIRYLWRVPVADKDEKLASTFSKGWGS